MKPHSRFKAPMLAGLAAASAGAALFLGGKTAVRGKSAPADALLGRRTAPGRGYRPSYLKGRVVLVSGAGGSIGSELCRQIAQAVPSRLVLLDFCENGVYELQQELESLSQGLPVSVEIGSVQDPVRLREIFSRYRPQVVFHAAAHKHVPLMEHCPGEAVKNNIFGTEEIARASLRWGTRRFVLISTDKAVNPSSVMGATKRFCEMLLQSMHGQGKTSFSAVRFGNVLGSNGSVVPLFLRQIERGGPVTVTDRRMIRYFMTIPEAVELVLRAGAMESGSGIYLLDMGRPVRILDLAERLIRLTGHLPYREIPIVETGLRPGEKLYEELLLGNGPLRATADRKILIEQQTPVSAREIERSLHLLRRAAETGSSGEVRRALMQAVPEYRPLGKLRQKSQSA